LDCELNSGDISSSLSENCGWICKTLWPLTSDESVSMISSDSSNDKLSHRKVKESVSSIQPFMPPKQVGGLFLDFSFLSMSSFDKQLLNDSIGSPGMSSIVSDDVIWSVLDDEDAGKGCIDTNKVKDKRSLSENDCVKNCMHGLEFLENVSRSKSLTFA
jgi:hypothetical protein